METFIVSIMTVAPYRQKYIILCCVTGKCESYEG